MQERNAAPEYTITGPGEHYKWEVTYHSGYLFGDHYVGGAFTKWGARYLIRKHRRWLAKPKQTVRIPG